MDTLTPVGAIRQTIEEQLVNLRYSDYPLLNRLQKNDCYQNNIKWNVNVSTNIGGNGRATDADAKMPDPDKVVPANLPIGDAAFTETVSILKTDVQQARNTGVGALKNLIKAHTELEIKKILRRFNQALYTGTGSVVDGGVFGMSSILTSNTYANIDSTVNTAWVAGFTDDNAGTNRNLNSALLSATETGIFNQGTGNFDAIFCTAEIFSKYKNLFTDERALLIPSIDATVDLGFTNVFYMGRPIIRDRDCPGNIMYFLDTMNLGVYTRTYTAQDESIEPLNIEGMTFTVYMLPSNNTYGLKFEIGVQGQLKATDRRAVNALLDLNQ